MKDMQGLDKAVFKLSSCSPFNGQFRAHSVCVHMCACMCVFRGGSGKEYRRECDKQTGRCYSQRAYSLGAKTAFSKHMILEQSGGKSSQKHRHVVPWDTNGG